MGCNTSSPNPSKLVHPVPKKHKANTQDLSNQLLTLTREQRMKILLKTLNEDKICQKCKNPLRNETREVACQTEYKAQEDKNITNNSVSIEVNSLHNNSKLKSLSDSIRIEIPSKGEGEDMNVTSEEDSKNKTDGCKFGMEVVQEVDSRLELPLGDTPKSKNFGSFFRF